MYPSPFSLPRLGKRLISGHEMHQILAPRPHARRLDALWSSIYCEGGHVASLIYVFRKLALQEAFQFVPSKFIESTFKEHNHYYGAYFAILETERRHGSAANPPYDKLRGRRGSSRMTSAILMEELRQEGFDFDGLKQEIDSAFQRRKRDDGTY